MKTYAVILENGVYRPYAVENDKPLFGTLIETIGAQNETNWELACNKADQLNKQKEQSVTLEQGNWELATAKSRELDRQEGLLLQLFYNGMFNEVFAEMVDYGNIITKITIETQNLSHDESIDGTTQVNVYDYKQGFHLTSSWEV